MARMKSAVIPLAVSALSACSIPVTIIGYFSSATNRRMIVTVRDVPGTTACTIISSYATGKCFIFTTPSSLVCNVCVTSCAASFCG